MTPKQQRFVEHYLACRNAPTHWCGELRRQRLRLANGGGELEPANDKDSKDDKKS